MKIILLSFGKTVQKQLHELEQEYLKKICKYNEIEHVAVKEPAGHTRLSATEQKRNEFLLFEKKIIAGDFCIVLDENGKSMNSVDFSAFIQKNMQLSYKRLVFIVGGPYGVSTILQKKSSFILSLSQMTYTHEMARIILLEQIYRSFNIIHNTPYHHI